MPNNFDYHDRTFYTEIKYGKGLFNYTGNAPVEPVPPTVTIISPTAGTTISINTPIVFKVEDELDSFKRIILVIEFPASGIKEVVFDGNGFGPMYTNGSNTVSTIDNGFQYQILRNGGWIPNDGPILTPFVIDTSGGENE